MSDKFISTVSSLIRLVYKPSIWLIILISATVGSNNSAFGLYRYALGRTSGETAGYSSVSATIDVPNKRIFTDEYIRGITEISDPETGVGMDAGPIQQCVYTGATAECQNQYHPSTVWVTSTGVTQLFVDTSIRLTPGASYFFKVDYAGNGSWQSQIRVGGTISVIYLKQLYLSRPMKRIGSGAEALYYGTGVGYYATTRKNQYRLGGTNSFRYYIYTQVANNPGTNVSSPVPDPYYEWFVTGP